MIKVCLVRGKYLNNFEGQNYLFNPKEIKLTAASTYFPIHRRYLFPVRKFLSPADFPWFSRGVKYLGNRLLGDAQALLGLEKVANQFDIFHSADPHYYYSYQLAKLRKKNLIKNLIVTSWETIPFNNESLERKKEIKYFTITWTDHFICYTEKAKSVLIKEGVRPDKISVVHLGVDLNKFYPAVKDKKSKSKKITLLFVGRLVKEKGIVDLYEAFKNLKSQISNLKSKTKILKLKIVGDGSLRDYLQNQIRLDNFINEITIEKQNYEDIPEVYQESDILVLPSKRSKSWEEQYAMVLVEAMASGLPIVAYDTGAISEVAGEAGILIPEGNIEKLATTIKQLIEVDSLRAKLGKMGRKRAEMMFDASKSAKKITEIYRRIVNS